MPSIDTDNEWAISRFDASPAARALTTHKPTGGSRGIERSRLLPFGTQAHRAVDRVLVLEQEHLLDTLGEQATPLLTDPRLRIGLGREAASGHGHTGDRASVRALVAPPPRHGRDT